MLEDLIYEHKGKIIGQRVLDNVVHKVLTAAAALPKIETTFSAGAKLKGRNKPPSNARDVSLAAVFKIDSDSMGSVKSSYLIDKV